MTNEEAIRLLKEDKAFYESDICYAGDGTPDGEWLEALDMAIAAIEKQIPKKPNAIEHKGITYRNCPACTSLVEDSVKGRRYLHNCGVCGQRICW